MSLSSILRKGSLSIITPLILAGYTLTPLPLKAAIINSQSTQKVYTIGRETPVERELYFDLFGKVTKPELEDVTGILKRVQAQYPRTKGKLNLHIKVGEIFSSDSSKRISGYSIAQINLKPSHLFLENREIQIPITEMDSCRYQIACPDFTAVNHNKTAIKYPGVNDSFKGRVYHGLSQLLFDKEFGSEEYMGLMEEFNSINKLSLEYIANEARKENVSLDKEKRNYKKDYGHSFGFVSEDAENSGNVHKEKIAKSQKYYKDFNLAQYKSEDIKKEKKQLEEKLAASFDEKDIPKYIDRIKEIEKFQELEDYITKSIASLKAKEDIIENISFHLQGLRAPYDPIIWKKQEAVKKFLIDVYKNDAPKNGYSMDASLIIITPPLGAIRVF